MAAEPVGSAYVIIRAITSQLAKDIKDGLDKGAKDADTDAAGREIGRTVGESAGDEFGDTWTERSSEEIEKSADSRDMRRSTDRFSDRIGDHMSDAFSDVGERIGGSMGERIGDGLRDSMGDIDRDEAAGSLGEDIADEQGKDYDVAWKRNVRKTFETTSDDGGVSTGIGRMMKGIGQRMSSAFSGIFRRGRRGGVDDTLNTGLSGIFMRAGRGSTQVVGDFVADVGTVMGNAFSNFFDRAGGGGGPLGKVSKSINGFFSQLELPMIGWAFTLGLPALGAAAQTVGALVGVMISVLGWLSTAALGAGVALAGVAAAAGPAFFVLKGAFTAPSEELDKFNEVLEGFKEAWQSVGRSAQTYLLPALGETLMVLDELRPMFEDYALFLGVIAGDIARDFGAALTSEENKGKIQNILSQGLPIIRDLGGALVTMIDPILSILEAAMPIAQDLARVIGEMAAHFSTFISKKRESGELAATFQLWWERLKQLGRIIGNFAKGLANVFGIGADSAQPLFDKIEGMATKFAEWTASAEGNEKLKTFFHNAWLVADELFGLIGDIIALIIGPMGETGGTGGIVDFIRTIREDWLPALVSIGTAIGDSLKGPAGDFIDALTGLISKLGEKDSTTAVSFMNVFTVNLQLFTLALKGLTALLGSEIGTKIINIALQVAFFAKVLSTFGLLTPVLNLLWAALGLVGDAILGLGAALLANPIVLAIAAVVAALTLLYFHFAPFRDFVDLYIIDPLQRLWSAIGGFQGIIDFFKELPETLSDFFTSLPENISEFFNSLPDLLSNLLADLAEFFLGLATNLPQLVADLFSGFIDLVIDVFQDLPSAIGGLAADLIGAATDWIVDIAPTAARLLGQVAGAILRFFYWTLPKAIVLAIPKLIEVAIKFLVDLPGNIVKLHATIGLAIARLFLALPGFFMSALDGMVDIIIAVFRAIPRLVMAALRALGIFIVTAFSSAFPEVVGWITDNVPRILDAIVSFFTDLPGKIADGFETVKDLFTGFAGQAWGWITERAGDFIDHVVEIWDWLIDNLGEVPGALAEYFTDLPGWLWEQISGAAGDFISHVTEIWGWLTDNIGQAPGALADFFTGLPGAMWNTISSAAGDFTSHVGEIWEWLTDNIGEVPGAVADFFTGIPGKIRDWIMDGIGALGEIGGGLMQEIMLGFVVWGQEHAPEAIQDAFGFDQMEDKLAPGTRHVREWVNDLEDVLEEFDGVIPVPEIPSDMTSHIYETMREITKVAGTEAGNSFGDSWNAAIADNKITADEIADLEGIANAFLKGGTDAGVAAMDGVSAGIEVKSGSMAAKWSSTWQDRIGRSPWAAAAGTAAATAAVDNAGATLAAKGPTLATTWGSTWQERVGRHPWAAAAGVTAATAAADSAGNTLATSTALESGWGRAVSAFDASGPAGDFAWQVGTATSSAFESTNSMGAAGESAVNQFGESTGDTLAGYDMTDPASAFGDNFSDTLTAQDAKLVASTNKLVDRILLTLARLGNEVTKTTNPFVLKLVDGMNKASEHATQAAKKLVDRVLLTLARLGNEVTRTTNPFVMRLVDGINKAATAALSAANSLVNRVLLTLSRLSNEAGRAVAGVAPALKSALSRAAAEAAGGLSDGFKWGMAGFINQLHGLAGQVDAAVGNLNSVLVDQGQQLVNGLIMGMASRLGQLRAQAAAVRTTAASAAGASTTGWGGGWGRGAMGGIFDSPSMMLIGEAGREALIPLTRPQQALHLMRIAGLDRMLRADDSRAGRGSKNPLGPDVTDVAMLRIDHAEIYDKIDVDIIAAQMRRAYVSATGH